MTPEAIKALRMRLGMTQSAFAHYLGVSFTAVNRWERGHNLPSPLARQALQKLDQMATAQDWKVIAALTPDPGKPGPLLA